ncbi:VanZ family protein [Benzoatithermus flavus]|uniref:VanZ family protein n=1 Tax=Benzoatithermus flavus TaxID=3108223 RepID=A0ABU8XSR4_9PROT
MRILIDARTRMVLFSLWCLGWAIVLVESLEPMTGTPFGLSDKLLHFMGYAVMTAAVASFAHERRGILCWTLFAILMGGLVEVAQDFVPTRSMDIYDFLADSAGAAVGATAALLWLVLVIAPLRRRRAAPA